MRRRFLTSTLLVAVTAVVALGVPLGVSFSHLRRNEAINVRDGYAQRAAAAVEHAQLTNPGSPVDLTSLTGGDYRVEATYTDGRTATAGPDFAATSWSGPLTTDHDVTVRVGIDAAIPTHRGNEAWALVGLLAGVGIAASLAIAVLFARRITGPLRGIAATSRQLGAGDFTARAHPAGIAELDEIIDALNNSAARIGDLVTAERDFSATASHQLRTPLTSLRLRLEDLAENPDPAAAHADIDAALATIDRLTATVDELLAFRRSGRAGVEADLDLVALLREHVAIFEPRFTLTRRRIRLSVDGRPFGRATRGAVGQALDVLLDNALRHGAGTVTATPAASGASGARIAVTDEGAGIAPDHERRLFDRDPARGVGLPLARLLIESDGGRLQLQTSRPPTFEILLPTGP